MTKADQSSFGQNPTAIYFSKRNVVRIEFSLSHTLSTHTDGWRFDFTESGQVRTITTDGPNAWLDVQAGDYLLSSGEDMYLSLKKPPKKLGATSHEGGEV